MAKIKHPRHNTAILQTQLRRSALATAISACIAAPAYANPTGATVANGSASFAANVSTLTITNSPGAVINWDSFSINKGELTQFIQQSAASQVLNRVTGGDPSQILGTLQSNGRVFLINPNGIAFGPGAQVDVAGLVVSTLNLSNENFLAGKLKFEAQDGAGVINNQGNINTASGGQVIIVAPKIENTGIITAPNGDILLAAGKSVNLIDLDHPEISVEITASANEAVNLGQLAAKNISIYGGIVSNSSTINANTAVVGENGKIILDAKESLTTTPTSIITANGSSGGSVVLASQGSTQIAGVVEAKAIELAATSNVDLANVSALAATTSTATQTQNAVVTAITQPPQGKGGNIVVLGDTVGVMDNASLDASGTQGGGRVLVGGDAQGEQTPLLIELTDHRANFTTAETRANQLVGSASSSPIAPITTQQVSATTTSQGTNNSGSDPLAPTAPDKTPLLNARITWVSSRARLRADAEQDGDGGKIIVWADDTARIYGQISAKGGRNSGHGGFVETSGKRYLDVNTVPDLTAAHGHGGIWLLDPNNITIQAAGSDTNVTGNPNFASTNDSSIITTATIEAALNAGTNVTITTGSSGSNSQVGDINVDDAISKTAGTDATLTLSAHNNININADIGSISGKLNLTLIANSDAVNGGASAIASGQTVTLNGGTLSFTNGLTLDGRIQNSSLVSVDGSALDSGISHGTLDGVTIGSNLTTGGYFLWIDNGLTLQDGVTVNNNTTVWGINGSGTQSINTTGTSSLVFAGGELVQYADNQTLIIDAGITLSGFGRYYSNINVSGTAIVNNGIIDANSMGDGIAIGEYAATFTNNGTLRLTGGTLLISASTWSNAGSIDLQAGTLSLGGNFSTADIGAITRSGGTVDIAGGLDNTGNTLDIGSGGVFGVGGLTTLYGTIKNGVLVSSDGTALNSVGGTLDGVSIGSNLAIASPGVGVGVGVGGVEGHAHGDVGASGLKVENGLLLDNGVTLDIGTGSMQFVYGGTISTPGSATINLAGGSILEDLTLTIGSGVTIGGSGDIGYGGTLVNDGTIVGNAVGQTLSINADTVTNTGTIQATTGTIAINTAGASWTNDGIVEAQLGAVVSTGARDLFNSATGTIRGTGTIDLGSTYVDPTWIPNTLTNSGTITPATGSGTIGTLTILGNLVNNGTVAIPLGGAAAGTYGQIVLADTQGMDAGQHSAAILGGTLIVLSHAGYTPPSGTSYTFMNFASASGSFANVNRPWANMSYNMLGNSLELLMSSSPDSTSNTSVIVSVGLMQTLIQGGLQNPIVVANAPAMASTVPSTSQMLAELGIETNQPIFFERRQPTGTVESCQ